MAKRDNSNNNGIILDSFSDVSLRQWNKISAAHEEYCVKMFYHLESLRTINHNKLCDALLAPKPVCIVAENWWRIVDHKYSNCPLSCQGSIKSGGRFNIGNDLSLSNFKPFPVLYIADSEETAYNEKFGNTVAANGLTNKELALRAASSYAAVRLKIEINNVFDLTNANNLLKFTKIISQFQIPSEIKELAGKLGMKPPYLVKEAPQLKGLLLSNDWRYYPVQYGIPANPQLFGRMLRDAGFEAVIYPSTKSHDHKNIAVFCENFEKSGSYVELQDAAPTTIEFIKLDSTTWKRSALP